MRKLLAIIGAVIAGGIGISLIPQAADAALASN
jgi:ABC-type phosphate/phosphonate transport system permease subunit